MNGNKTVQIIVEGKVQGVFYRATTREVAEKIGVKGWVRNREDGSVEIMASGSEAQLKEFIDWCRKGPKRAEVSNVTVTTVEGESFKEFQVIRK